MAIIRRGLRIYLCLGRCRCGCRTEYSIELRGLFYPTPILATASTYRVLTESWIFHIASFFYALVQSMNHMHPTRRLQRSLLCPRTGLPEHAEAYASHDVG
jgi:hypothetical protein